MIDAVGHMRRQLHQRSGQLLGYFGAALLCAALVTPPHVASASPVEIEATGSGSNKDEAIAHALDSAVSQVVGVAISSDRSLTTSSSSRLNESGKTAQLSKDARSDIRSATNGIVRNYRIIDVSAGPGGGLVAQLSVTVEIYQAPDTSKDTRRRIAVVAFADGAGGRGVGAALRDRITADLVQGRRFAVVDRSNDDAYKGEMALLQGGDAPLTERVRVGQVIGADYVVVGKLRATASTRSAETISLTGEVVVNTTPGAIDVEFQVIEIATRQVSWAGSAHSSGTGGVDRIAGTVVDDIMRAIYPIRLIRFDDPSALIMNQGGGTLRPGQRFRAFILGDSLVDPYTQEQLGQDERQVGIVEVTRVDTKVSYARLVSGKLPPAGGDALLQIVLRPAPAEVVRATGAPGARQEHGQANASGTKLPFDK